MKRRTSIFWRVIAGLILAPVLLLALLQTPPGKMVLASALSKGLSRSENFELRIGKISGWIPAKVDISEIEIGDAQGIWLTAKELHFRWMIREIPENQFRLKALRATELELHRFPRSGKKEPTAKKEREAFEPMEVVLDDLQVQRFKLGKGVAGMPLEYRVHSGGITLQPSGRLSGELTVTGDAEGRVELDALLSGHESDRLTIRAELEQLNNPTFGLDHLSGHGEVIIRAGGVEGTIAAGLQKDDQRGTMATQLRYSKRKLTLQEFKLNSGTAVVNGDLLFDFSPGLIDVELRSTCFDAATNRYEVRGRAAVATSNKTWAVQVETLNVRGWETVAFELAGRLAPDEVLLEGKLVEFDIGELPLFGMSNFTGGVSGQLSVVGTLENPQVIAGVNVAQFASASDALDELPALDFSVLGGVVNGELFVSTSLTNYSSGFLSANAVLPCAFSLVPFTYQPDLEQWHGNLEADLNFEVFNRLALLENQFLEGAFEADLVYENGAPSGYLKLHGGQYEHYDWGLVFRGLEANLKATPTGFVFKHASATDGHGGSMELSGGFGRNGLGIQLNLHEARVLQRPEFEAQVSGQLNLTGRAARPQVGGTLVIDRAEILLDNMVSAKPSVLTNFDAQAITNAAHVTIERKPLPFDMDIRVEMPDQVYVVASLIDSVLGGEFRLQTTPVGLSVSGTVEPRRGYVNFIGKKFRFQKEGEVVLDGAVPAAPVFNNLTAEYSRSDITARLVLNGRVNNPQYRLESTPAMPEDEILSQVLFNRDTTTISPYQAYQIAAAAQQLSGGLNGPGFMYQFRRAVGVDTLEWREANATGESSTVAAGKYITPDLYVEVSSSFETDTETGMMAEYEITRHLSIETSTGPQMRPGIGVNWKTDY